MKSMRVVSTTQCCGAIVIILVSLLFVAGSARGDVEITFLTESADEGANNTLSLDISIPIYAPSWYSFILHGVLVHFDWMAANENASANPVQFPVTLEWGDSVRCDITFFAPRGIANETYHNYTLILEMTAKHIDGVWLDPEELRFGNAIFIQHTDPATPSDTSDLTTLVILASGVVAAVAAVVIVLMLRKRRGRPTVTSVLNEEPAIQAP